MTKKIICILLVFVSVFFTGCSNKGNDKISLEELYSFKKDFLILEDVKIENYIDENQTVDKRMKIFDELNHDEFLGSNEFINKEEVEKELEKYFSYIKDTYPGYEIFGGEEVFKLAKENILTSLPNDMDSDYFEFLVRDNTGFIRDKHFMTNEERIKGQEEKWF